MPVSHPIRLAVTAALALAGIAPGASAAPAAAYQTTTPAQVRTEAAGAAPVQVIGLTTSTGEATDVALAGVEQAQAPAGTSAGTSVVGVARAQVLQRATEAARHDGPEFEATLLTEPLEVSGFLVAGLTWTGATGMGEDTTLYLRVREDGAWTDWYVLEASDAGRDDLDPATAVSGTDEFVTGGADAVQAAVVAGSSPLPADLSLRLVPGEPVGEEHLEAEDLTVAEADDTGVATDAAAAAPTGQEPTGTGPTTTGDETAVPATSDAAPSAAPEAAAPTASPSTVPAGTSAGAAARPGLPALLAAATTQGSLPVPVTTRSEWGANASYLSWDTVWARASHVVVHHTAGTNDYTRDQAASVVRGIYYYHAVSLGWGDVGYNFLVDKYGTVYEGRNGTLTSAAGTMAVGGHAYGANTGTMGISMMGTYTSVSPSQAQLTAVGQLAGWFLARGGVTSATAYADFTIKATERYRAGTVVSLPRILAHRDVGYTACPGDTGYSRMGDIRAAAQQVISGGQTTTRTATLPAGWYNDGKVWRYRSATGEDVTGWALLDGDWYYLGTDGAMRSGWQRIGGTWYHLSHSGVMTTGWLTSGSSRYYLSPSGAMVTGWARVNGSWYSFGPSGAMRTGWLAEGGSWYHLADSGAMHVGWVRDKGSWYYLNASGAMVTGWVTIGGTWYHLGSSGPMTTGWLLFKGTWYYFDGAGAMVTGTRLVDGASQTFSSTGAWQG